MIVEQGYIKYVQEPGAILRLCSDIKGLDTIYCIGGRRALELVKPTLAVENAVIHFAEHTSPTTVWSDARQYADELLAMDAQAVIGVGGGAAMDIAKAAAAMTGRALYLIPTSAATCSAATTLIALYDQEGRRTGKHILPRPIDGIYVDEDILKCAPNRLLASGIADSIAKLSEAASACLYADNPAEPRWLSMMAQAMHLMDIYYNYAQPALEGDADTLRQVVYANLCLTAQITATGSDRRIGEIAHHFYNGVTCLFPQQRYRFLHGEIVGVGVLLEMSLTGAIAGHTVRSIRAFLRDVLKCPVSIADMHLPDDEVSLARLTAYISEKSGLSPISILPALRNLLSAQEE